MKPTFVAAPMVLAALAALSLASPGAAEPAPADHGALSSFPLHNV